MNTDGADWHGFGPCQSAPSVSYSGSRHLTTGPRGVACLAQK